MRSVPVSILRKKKKERKEIKPMKYVRKSLALLLALILVLALGGTAFATQ